MAIVGAVGLGTLALIAGPPAFVTGTIAVGAWYVAGALCAAAGLADAYGI